MARITRLTENDLSRIVRQVIVEQNPAALNALRSTTAAIPGGGGTPTAKGLKPAIGASTGGPNFNYNSLRPCKPGEEGKLVKQSTIFALSRNTPFCKIVITNTGSSNNPASRDTGTRL